MIEITRLKYISLTICGIVFGLVGSILLFGELLINVYDEITFDHSFKRVVEIVDTSEVIIDSLIIKSKSGHTFNLETKDSTAEKLNTIKKSEKIVLIYALDNVYIIQDVNGKIIYKDNFLRKSHIQSGIILFLLTITFIFIFIKSISLLKKVILQMGVDYEFDWRLSHLAVDNLTLEFFSARLYLQIRNTNNNRYSAIYFIGGYR